MYSVRIGQTEVAYEVIRSPRARDRKITVTSNHVEIVALESDSETDIADFVARKKKWLFNALREMTSMNAKPAVVPRLITGSRIPYRGRSVRLNVQRHNRNGQASVPPTIGLAHFGGIDANDLANALG